MRGTIASLTAAKEELCLDFRFGHSFHFPWFVQSLPYYGNFVDLPPDLGIHLAPPSWDDSQESVDAVEITN